MFVSRNVCGAVADLLDQGFTEAQIAWRLGVAPTTVSYHRARLLARPHAPERQRTASTGSRFRRVETRRPVGELLNEGLSRSEAARRLGLSKATISYHARRLGAPVDERCARRYDWAAVQQYYDLGHSVRECRAAFGFTSQTWHAAVQRGSVIPRPHPMPIEQLLAEGCPRNRQHIKRRLISAGLRTDRCEGCGLQHWRGMRVSTALHHINGDRHDNRLANLQLLCPNCHSQTSTFSGRNREPRPDGVIARPNGAERPAWRCPRHPLGPVLVSRGG